MERAVHLKSSAMCVACFFAVITVVTPAYAARRLPLPSGDYTFVQKDAEFPDRTGRRVTARIHDRHIVLVDRSNRAVLEEGELVWHAASYRWIIAISPEDRHAPEVGGCSAGPDEIDLRRRIWWTC